jgi:hypothetical protein
VQAPVTLKLSMAAYFANFGTVPEAVIAAGISH